jgi:hypothetical protein
MPVNAAMNTQIPGSASGLASLRKFRMLCIRQRQVRHPTTGSRDFGTMDNSVLPNRVSLPLVLVVIKMNDSYSHVLYFLELWQR